MITMMVLLCYSNLSGMPLECIVIVLMNNSLLGGQECTDYVNVQRNGWNQLYYNRLGIVPRLNFTCNGRITSIRARVNLSSEGSDYPFIQVWRARSAGSTIYHKIDEVKLPADDQVIRDSNNYTGVTINLTGNNRIEVQSGDVVGYYHPRNARYRVRGISIASTDGYVLYRFNGMPTSNSVNLSEADRRLNYRQPLLQFTIGTQ